MDKTIRKIAILVASAIALGLTGLAHAADASPPERMTYQGYLVDSADPPVPLGNTAPVNYDVVFRIYNVKQDGNTENILWAEQQTVTVDNGYFSALLGEGSVVNSSEPHDPLSAVFVGSDAPDRFLGITVKGLGGGDVEIAPRLRLVTSPFTFLAAHAGHADKIVGSGGDVLTTDGGNIGIGNTSPDAKLDVAGNIKASGAVDVGGDANVQGQLAVGKSTAPSATLDVAGTVKASGGLDIDGDSSIDGTLTLKPVGAAAALTIRPASGSGYSTEIFATDAGSFIRNNSSSRKIFLGANSQNTIVITPDGRVGINATYPTKTLDVGGSIGASGDITTSGWLMRGSDGMGGLVGYHGTGGAWNSDTTNPIFILGSGYKPSEKNLDGMYGIGFSHPNANFITGNAHEWGLYVAAAGTANAFISGYALSGRSYIKNKRGGLGVGTDSPDTDAALTASGEDSTLGYSSWPKSLYVTNESDTLGVIAGPGKLFMGFHYNNTIYFGKADYGGIGQYYGYINDLGWNTYSDIRLKEDIQPISSSLDRLEKVRGVNFKWKNSNQRSYGVIAQEMEKEFPELVNEALDGMKGVTYDNITPILLEGLKELRREKDEQLARKDERINQLEARLARLEQQVGKIIGQGQ